MLEKNDPDFRYLTDANYLTLACFNDENMDTFFLVTFNREKSLFWMPPPEPNGIQEVSDGIFEFSDYINGLANRSDVLFIRWKRLVEKKRTTPALAMPIAELGAAQEGVGVKIDEASVLYWTHFTNKDGDKMEYTLNLRRSTNRFEENYKYSKSEFSRSGRCVTF